MILANALTVRCIPLIKTISSGSQNSLCLLNACLCLTDDTTGTHSVYTVYHGHEIMFHVSTMLPYSKENKQQVRVNTGSSRIRKASNGVRNVEKASSL